MLVFILIGIRANAQTEQKDTTKAKDIKIEKKKLISEEERKALDGITKGKSSSAARNKNSQIFATGAIGQPIPATGQRYAIVIGLANYSGTVNDLCAAAAETEAVDSSVYATNDPKYYCQDYDSIHMRDELINRYGYDPMNIVVLRDGSATKANIMQELNNLSLKLNGDDEVAFFYSGHGVSGNYYGIVDGESVDEAIYTYDGQYVWDDDLKLWADSLQTYRQVFAFDMCLAGGMNELAGLNRVIAMSSTETQSSFTYTIGGIATTTGYAFSEGLFSHNFVVNGMTNLLADSNNLKGVTDGDVTVEEAFSYTYPIIKIKQTPVLSDQYVNDLLLGY